MLRKSFGVVNQSGSATLWHAFSHVDSEMEASPPRQRGVQFREEKTPMTGIQFITDAKGRKTAAIIDLKKHKALWEDIQDILVSRSRRNEKRIPLEKVKADLIASGKLRA